MSGTNAYAIGYTKLVQEQHNMSNLEFYCYFPVIWLVNKRYISSLVTCKFYLVTCKKLANRIHGIIIAPGKYL